MVTDGSFLRASLFGVVFLVQWCKVKFGCDQGGVAGWGGKQKVIEGFGVSVAGGSRGGVRCVRWNEGHFTSCVKGAEETGRGEVC